MRTRMVLVATGAAATLAIGGTAYGAVAGGPVDSSGVVDGCYANLAIKGSHALVLQDAGTTCPKGTTAVTWNQQGVVVDIDSDYSEQPALEECSDG